MEKFLTGDKNIDSIILKDFTDDELFKICLTGKYGRELCNYEPFWYNRLETKFPYFLRTKPQEIGSKNYYVYLVKIISEMLEDFKIEQKDIDQKSLEDLPQKQKNKALRWASKRGYLEIVKYLVENGADTNTLNGYPLRKAAEKGYLEIVKYLVYNGPKINVLNQALTNSSEKGQLEIVKYLVENGADIHQNNNYPLKRAVRNGHLEVMKYLIKNGDGIYDKNNLILLAAENGRLEIIKYLVQIKTDIPENAISRAVRNGHLEVIKYLVQIGGDIIYGYFFLKMAAENGHLNVVKYLIENGVNANDAISEAVKNGHLEVVKYLVEKGSTSIRSLIRLANKYGQTEIERYLRSL